MLNYIRTCCRLSYIKSARAAASAQELKCVLMLVRVARGLGAAGAEPRETGAEPHTWRGLISYDLLKRAAVDAVDEVYNPFKKICQ